MQRRGGVPLAPRVHSKKCKVSAILASSTLGMPFASAYRLPTTASRASARLLLGSVGVRLAWPGHKNRGKIHALGPNAQFKSVAQCLNGRKMTSCVLAHACKRNAFARRGRQLLCWAVKSLTIGIKLARDIGTASNPQSRELHNRGHFPEIGKPSPNPAGSRWHKPQLTRARREIGPTFQTKWLPHRSGP
jgi:hypothetical protein